MIFKERPDGFSPEFTGVGCFCETDGKILALKRIKNDTFGGHWGLPFGKAEQGEKPHEAMNRELREETGIYGVTIKPFVKLFVRNERRDFICYLYTANTPRKEIVLDPKEHQDFRWISPENLLTLPLVMDLDVCIQLYLEKK